MEKKLITQPEKSVLVDPAKVEKELEDLKRAVSNIRISIEEIDAWIEEETQRQEDKFEQRIQHLQGILNQLNG